MKTLIENSQGTYVHPVRLLALCEDLVSAAPTEKPEGSGTADDPYIMRTAMHWVYCQRTGKTDELFLRLAGRLIRKNKNAYASDIGPSYKFKNLHDKKSIDKQFYLNLERRNAINQPTYSAGAEFIEEPRKIYDRPESGRAIQWSDISYSPTLSRAIWSILRGEKLPLVEGNSYDRDYSRKQFMLPVFVAAIFLSEPTRNSRAWPINLMLLDLAQKGQYAWSSILWNTQTKSDGIMPMSGQGAAGVLKGQLSVKGGSSVDCSNIGYFHEREADVLVKWLDSQSSIRREWTVAEVSIEDIKRKTPLENPRQSLTIWSRIKDRINSLDPM